ncbi:MAG: hypothetical protein QG656_2125 [Candidatus Hydrogenedentes bacterium]|nr:hypothetical protein [Candidatus Hydrogenedentota bacterium]
MGMRSMSLGLALWAACAAHGAAPTFQELMDPAVFAEPQRGMTVERAVVEGDALTVVTTGAEMTLDAAGKAVFRQRIGHPREVVTVYVEGANASAPELTHRGPGLAFAKYSAPRFDLRVNGDSLFMFHAVEPLTLRVERAIEAGFCQSQGAHHLLLDEWGGFGLYCSDEGMEDGFDRFESVTARYTLPAGAVLWVAICPPKPYDWDRSFKDQVVWHWSNTEGYPADDVLAGWASEGNIVLLQSEVMLWKDWNLAFVPREGEDEFARVRKTIHDSGMRFIVYTSPAYFFRGTPFERYAFNSFDNFAGWPPGRDIGDNIDLFMAEIGKVMSEYKPDGLYFDGQYCDSPAALYTLARRTRTLLGEDGILEWHSTIALGNGLCFLPQADAYVDFILRGEGRDGVYEDVEYLRHFVSCYNSSNSIGVLCNNGAPPTAELVRRLLSVNCRMHTIASWLSNPELAALLDTEYTPRLVPALREEVERNCEARQAEIPGRMAVLAEERRALLAPPAWSKAQMVEAFDRMPEWKQAVSTLNENPFAIEDGALAVTGKASTFAFVTRDLDKPSTGFVVKLRQGTDQGMSWGVGACLRWKNAAFLRLGLRSDGQLQADINGEQRLAELHDPGQWVWLRARWFAHSGVIERSDDGTQFHTVWTFDHGGSMNGPSRNISVGKVPFNGEALDYKEPGEAGTCYVGDLVVY